MAEEWNSLKIVRMKLKDPAGVIILEHVSDTTSLPATPKRQAAYRTDDSGNWQTFDGTKWSLVDLSISDERLNELIAANGVDGAVVEALPEIIATLFDRLQIVSTSSGVESFQYLSLEKAIAFYKEMRNIYSEQKQKSSGLSTGRFFRGSRPEVGGIREW